MRYRKLGDTGLEVSEIGFGAWGIGGSAEGALAYGLTDDRESKAALQRAYELGVTYYDTAALYGLGHSERLIGETLKGVRSKIAIGTKVGFTSETAQDFSPGHIQRSLEGSLRRLQTDYVDLYQLHSPPIRTLEQDGEVLTCLRRLRDEGKCLAYGISVRSPEDGLAAVSEFGFRCIQVNFNLVDQRALTTGLFDLCQREGVGVIVRTPLCFGFLTGAYSAESEFGPDDHRSRWSSDQIRLWASASLRFQRVFLGDREQSDSQKALRFCLSCASVSTVIPGMLTTDHVEENVSASEMGPLPKSELQAIEQIYSESRFFVS